MQLRMKKRYLTTFSNVIKGYPFKDDQDVYMKLAEPVMDPVYGNELNCVSLSTGTMRFAEADAQVEPVTGTFVEDGAELACGCEGSYD